MVSELSGDLQNSGDLFRTPRSSEIRSFEEVSKKFRKSFEKVSKWFRNGFEMVSKWFRNGFEMVSKWFRNGFEMVSKWFLNGFETVSKPAYPEIYWDILEYSVEDSLWISRDILRYHDISWYI